ncbi:MAG: YigZ family protein [Calditrichaeota bacterium]|nr:MAG: YigZ family protein [Calditrichota bacterium]
MPDPTDQYRVPARAHSAEIKVKGSRFIAHVLPAADTATAEALYAEIKKKYYNATHNCPAWRITPDEWRYSDDGEPGGTAGKPILKEIVAADLLYTLCVVTRYFGGTKLGTGGLIRAYGEAARAALSTVPVEIKIRTRTLELRFGYELESSVRHFITRFEGKIEASDYSNGVIFRVAIPLGYAEDFIRTTGEAHLNKIEWKCL